MQGEALNQGEKPAGLSWGEMPGRVAREGTPRGHGQKKTGWMLEPKREKTCSGAEDHEEQLGSRLWKSSREQGDEGRMSLQITVEGAPRLGKRHTRG